MGFDFYNNYANTPMANLGSWNMNYTPTYSWDGGFGGFGGAAMTGGFGTWGNAGFGASSTSSSSASSTDETKTKTKRFDLNTSRARQAVDEFRNKFYDKEYHEFKNSITETGESKAIKKLSEKPWYTVLGRGALNVLNGTMLPFKQMLGFNNKGKWDWKKCLKNIGIGAAITATTFIPGVGPFIATGLGYAALAYGGYSVGKGVVNTVKAIKNDDLKAFDKATQDIGYGGVTFLTARSGLKANGSKLLTGRISEFKATGKFDWKIGAGFRSAATKSKTILSLTKQAHAGGENYFKSYFGALKKVGRIDPALKANDSFAQQKASTLQSLDARIAEIDNKMLNASGQELELLNTQKLTLGTLRSKIEVAKTSKDWNEITAIVSEGKGLSNENLGFWSRNFKYRSNKKFYSNLNKEMLALRQSRFKTMRDLQGFKGKIGTAEQQELTNFWGSDKVPFYQRYWQTFRSAYNKDKITSPGFLLGNGFQLSTLFVDPIFILFNPVKSLLSKPSLASLNVMLGAEHEFAKDTYYEKTEKEDLTAEETQARLESYDSKYLEEVQKIAKKYNIEDPTTLLSQEELQRFSSATASAQNQQSAQQPQQQQQFVAQA